MIIKILFWIVICILAINAFGTPMLIHLLLKEKKKCKMLEYHLDWIAEHDDNIKIEKDEKGNIEKITSTKTFMI